MITRKCPRPCFYFMPFWSSSQRRRPSSCPIRCESSPRWARTLSSSANLGRRPSRGSRGGERTGGYSPVKGRPQMHGQGLHTNTKMKPLSRSMEKTITLPNPTDTMRSKSLRGHAPFSRHTNMQTSYSRGPV